MASHGTNMTGSVSSDDGFSEVPEAQSFLEVQDEGVLGDVLAELDRERSMRAELEAKVRDLEQQVNSHRRKYEKQASSSVATKEYIQMETEKNGYLELVEALTKDRPAFAANVSTSSKKSSSRNGKTNEVPKLPLHVIRLLEIIPWDSSTKPYLFGQEHLYEWQMWNSQKQWQRELRHFPTFFKTLPIVIPQPGHTVTEAATKSTTSPPKQCVLTNIDVTQILNINSGYPLPEDGGHWQWIGGWRIEKTMDTDNQGWSYSNSPEITSSSNYYSEFQTPSKGTPNLVKRRRKWIRSRVLVDYPSACTATKEYLKLVAEKASHAITVEKLSRQLVETKMKLTSLEDDHLKLQEETSRKIIALENEMKEKDLILASIEGVPNSVSTPGAKNQVKEIRSLVTQWVSDTVTKRPAAAPQNDSAHDGNTIDSEYQSDEEYGGLGSAAASSASTSKQQMFAWTKAPDILEKLKQTGGHGLESIKQAGVVDKIRQTSGQGIERFKQTGVVEKMKPTFFKQLSSTAKEQTAVSSEDDTSA